MSAVERGVITLTGLEAMPIRGKMETKPIEELQLDANNPRLPEQLGLAQEDQDGLAVFVAEEYDALRIARSIAEFGYFPTEPPICVEDNGNTIVVEGNRRLAALKILRSQRLREHPDLTRRPEWNTLAESNLIPDELEVLIVPNRHEVAPLVAYRHISGIEAWEPWAQARFVARLVDQQDVDFTETASLVGESETTVKRYYRDHGILMQANDAFGLDTSRAEARFGVFTRAMQDGGIREYIGAPTPGQTERGRPLVRQEKRQEIQNLLGWLFGTADRQKVIDESRDISALGRVLGSTEEEAHRLLLEENDLSAAFAAAGGIKDRLLRYLRDAANACTRAREDLPEYVDDEEVLEAIRGLNEEIESIREIIA